MRYWVFRFDTNPSNLTFGRWCRMCGPFNTRELAEAFIRRAQTASQQLRVEAERA